jgi:pilus assembly protein FimV
MFRKLSLAVAISGFLSPVGVHALGLGDIHLGSALNQRLNAEISVHLARTEELEDIKIELASPEAFARAGIGRPFLLSSLQFSPVQNSDGETIIAVTSREPIREPFLNFLVEVNWPKGRLVREYTVLLDPPVTVQRRAEAVHAPVVASQGNTYSAPPANEPFETGEAREYGPVVVEDTLWNIASRMRAKGESVEQVMMALLDNNPSAFIHNNINRLKRGSILRLPASDDVQALDKQQARSEFLAQTRQWRDQNTVTSTSLNDISSPSSPIKNPVDGGDHLKLASASKEASETSAAIEGSAGGTAGLSELEQELILVREANEVVRQEGVQLRTRVGELETQIQDIQRLLTLKNDQLAQIQDSQQLDEVVMENAPEVMTHETPLEEIAPEAEEIVQENQEIAPVAQDAQQVEEPAIAEVVEVAPVEAEPEIKPEVVVTPVEQLPVTPSASPSGLDAFLGNPQLIAAAGGGIALLLAIAAFIMRRRSSSDDEFAESILVAPKDAPVESGSDIDLAPASSDETSLLSDFSPSDIDALQDETGEVDPLSEADVYVAYGRYQQAEELITQAIEKDDDRVELKFKLLEIYYSIQNKSAFIELAQSLADSGAEEQSPQAWAQVVSMGQELVPEESLFGASSAQQSDDVNVALADNTMDELDELDDFDLGDLESELNLDGDDDSLLNNDGLQNLADEGENIELPESVDLPTDEIEPEIDLMSGLDESSLELGDLSIADESLNLDDIDLGAELDGDISDLDLDDLSLSLDSELATGDEPESEESPNRFDDEEIDLGSLGDELESLSGDLESGDFEINLDEMNSTIEGDAPQGEDEFDLGIEEEETPSAPAELNESADLSEDLADDDEVETKLDLARAYADMGDKEGAENILQEVLSEGSDAQKEEAESLIKSLS